MAAKKAGQEVGKQAAKQAAAKGGAQAVGSLAPGIGNVAAWLASEGVMQAWKSRKTLIPILIVVLILPILLPLLAIGGLTGIANEFATTLHIKPAVGVTLEALNAATACNFASAQPDPKYTYIGLPTATSTVYLMGEAMLATGALNPGANVPNASDGHLYAFGSYRNPIYQIADPSAVASLNSLVYPQLNTLGVGGVLRIYWNDQSNRGGASPWGTAKSPIFNYNNTLLADAGGVGATYTNVYAQVNKESGTYTLSSNNGVYSYRLTASPSTALGYPDNYTPKADVPLTYIDSKGRVAYTDYPLNPDLAGLQKGGDITGTLELPAALSPSDWTSLAAVAAYNPLFRANNPDAGQHGVGFLLITPYRWRVMVANAHNYLPVSIKGQGVKGSANYIPDVSSQLSPWSPQDSFLVTACDLQATITSNQALCLNNAGTLQADNAAVIAAQDKLAKDQAASANSALLSADQAAILSAQAALKTAQDQFALDASAQATQAVLDADQAALTLATTNLSTAQAKLVADEASQKNSATLLADQNALTAAAQKLANDQNASTFACLGDTALGAITMLGQYVTQLSEDVMALLRTLQTSLTNGLTAVQAFFVNLANLNVLGVAQSAAVAFGSFVQIAANTSHFALQTVYATLTTSWDLGTVVSNHLVSYVDNIDLSGNFGLNRCAATCTLSNGGTLLRYPDLTGVPPFPLNYDTSYLSTAPGTNYDAWISPDALTRLRVTYYKDQCVYGAMAAWMDWHNHAGSATNPWNPKSVAAWSTFGNALSWYTNAQAAGWTVSKTDLKPGMIIVYPAYYFGPAYPYGHVALVVGVSTDNKHYMVLEQNFLSTGRVENYTWNTAGFDYRIASWPDPGVTGFIWGPKGTTLP